MSKTYYVVLDKEDDEVYITEEPSPTDEVLFETQDLEQAEKRLCREMNLRGE